MAAQRRTSTPLVAVLISAAMVVVVAQAAAATTVSGGTKGNGEELVVKACKNVTAGFLENMVPTFDEEHCVSVLLSDKRSAVAKDHGDLVMVAMDLLDRRINEMVPKIDSMLHSFPVHKHNKTEYALQVCAANFAEMVRTLPVCHDIFMDLKSLGTKVKEKFAMVALKCMDRMGGAARTCNLWLDDSWSLDVLRYTSLPRGLMELATGCTNHIPHYWL